MKDRTYAKKNGERPSHVRANQNWWFTHLRLRQARGTLATVLKTGHLFTWLTHAPEGHKLPRTTSPLEGGINAGLKHLLRDHRGLSDDHAKRAVDWYLYHHTQSPKDPWTLVKPRHWQPSKKAKKVIDEPIGPALYGTAFSYQDGNGIQQGWGGRSH